MLGAAYGLSRELRVGCFIVVLIKAGLSGLSPDYFCGQAWSDLWLEMTNVCYCCKLNNMLNV